MALVIVCERPCNSVELGKVMALDERLEWAGMGLDTRINLDNASVVVGAVGDSVAVSLLGTIYGESFTATAVSESVGQACGVLADTVCKILKVDEQPF